jgi:hypothetical protein
LTLLAGCNRAGQDTNVATESSPPQRGETVKPGDGHQKMLALLDEIARRASDENFYTGSSGARKLRQQLETFPPEATPAHRVQILRQLASAELNLGNTRESIDLYTQAYQLLDEKKMPPALVYNVTFRLGIAFLRLGETQNCCRRHHPDSCIIPIQGGGVHQEPEGSRKAIQYFEEALRRAPPNSIPHFAARWILNIAYMTLGEYPDRVPKQYLIPEDRFRSRIQLPRFNDVAQKVGLASFNNSGGAIVDDFDGDDLLDVMTTSANPEEPMLYFRNQGDGTFSNRTAAAGLEGLRGGLNLVQADYDNDGDLDALVLRGGWFGLSGKHPNSLLQNQGGGVFTDVTFEAGLGEAHYPTQTAAWSDYDNDGDLDLYIGNEMANDERQTRSPLFYPQGLQEQIPSQLFRNNGDGSFTDVAIQAGVQNLRFAKGVCWGDYNEDRFPDLYVSNLEENNRLYKNNGDGTFTDVAPEVKVLLPSESFPAWFWDYNNDGALDLLVTSYTAHVGHLGAYYLGLNPSFEPPCLYQGDGKGGFKEVAKSHNLVVPMLPMGANFGDLNNDGFLDFYLGTGDPDYLQLHPNLMFLNQGGKRFEDVTMTVGMGHLQKGHGVSFADMDNDGDLDVFQQMGGIFLGDRFSNTLYENPGFGHGWISLRLEGVRSNRSAIGARIHLSVSGSQGTRSIYRTVCSGGSFGCNPLRQTIGIGKAERIDRLEVFWPTTGETQVFKDVKPNQALHLVEGKRDLTPLSLKTLRF